MSVVRHMEIWVASNGAWYIDVAEHEHGGPSDSTTYGPFVSEESAYLWQRDEAPFPNPGGFNVDRSGNRPKPTESPNGWPVQHPRRAGAREAGEARSPWDPGGGGCDAVEPGTPVVVLDSHAYEPYRGLAGTVEKYVPFCKAYVNLDNGERIMVDVRDLGHRGARVSEGDEGGADAIDAVIDEIQALSTDFSSPDLEHETPDTAETGWMDGLFHIGADTLGLPEEAAEQLSFEIDEAFNEAEGSPRRGTLRAIIERIAPGGPVVARAGEGHTFREFEEAMWNLAARAADEAHRLWWRAGYPYAAYVYFLPNGMDLKVALETDAPGAPWEIAINERLPADRTRDQLRNWIHDRIRRIPLLPTDEAELDRRVAALVVFNRAMRQRGTREAATEGRSFPSKPREGTRVRFVANPAGIMLYTSPPERGETGSVTTVPLPGVGRRTWMAGPGGGLVYVQWDSGFTMGVSPWDLERE